MYVTVVYKIEYNKINIYNVIPQKLHHNNAIAHNIIQYNTRI